MDKRPTRNEVPSDLTWNLEDLFPSQQSWEQELEAIEQDIPAVVQYRGRLREGAAVLKACLNAQEALYERFYRAFTYAGLRMAEDGTSPANQACYDKAQALLAKGEASMAFIKSELLALPAGTIERFVSEDSELASLRFYLERMVKTKPHQLSEETEVALASLGEVHGAPYLIYERAKSSDMQFPSFKDGEGRERELSFALYEDAYEDSPDLVTRRNAYEAFVKGLKGYQNTLAATFATEIKKNVVLARLRKYPSATEMLLESHLVTAQAYNNVLDIIQAELAPHMRRYAALRKRLLGLDKLLYCDIEAPIDPSFSPKITYAEASDLILDALSVMGQEYSKIMRTALKERWVDLADNVGKSTGAFCSSPYGNHSYILITWTDSARGALVLAHELGHAGHFELANRYQRLFNTEPSTFFVEAPSTINELLVGHRMMEKSTDVRMRRWVIMQFLATYHHNFVRHLLEGELQRRVYAQAEQGQPITAQMLSKTKGEILESFWGGAVEIDEGARLTWMRQPHYYMGLYPYTYSAGLTLATAVAQLIREEGQPAVDRWLQVLKSGGTRGPLELAAMAGVDMSRPETIRKAVSYVGSLVDELEKSFR